MNDSSVVFVIGWEVNCCWEGITRMETTATEDRPGYLYWPDTAVAIAYRIARWTPVAGGDRPRLSRGVGRDGEGAKRGATKRYVLCWPRGAGHYSRPSGFIVICRAGPPTSRGVKTNRMYTGCLLRGAGQLWGRSGTDRLVTYLDGYIDGYRQTDRRTT
jgi:hypothetical protein